MTSVLFLEEPGHWRSRTVVVILLLAAIPVVPLLAHGLRSDAPALGTVFWQSVWLSVGVGICAAALGALVGLPLGVLAALYDFPGRKALLIAVALPLLVPSFLLAIGWSELAARVPSIAVVVHGSSGCTLVFATVVTPLVLFAAYAATLALSRSQAEAALLAGGEGRVFGLATRHALMPALLAATLGGIVTLADPGAGEILGASTAATEVLTTFAAHYDIALAARQCLVLTALVFCAAVPLSFAAGDRLSAAVLARETAPLPRGRAGLCVTVGFALLGLVSVLIPLSGMLLPMISGPWPLAVAAIDVTRENWQRNRLALLVVDAVGTVARTALNTVLYAGGAGLIATALGFGLACAVGRQPGVRKIILVVALVLFAWPPAASALGTATLASAAPAWFDPLLRSRLTVCTVLGLRLLPVSAVLGLRAWGAMAPSWTYAAALHDVPPWRFLRRVVWPALRTSAACSVLVVSLLASADVGTVLLLHPPGEDSLPLTVFTVMANAPATTVVTLCLLYLAAAFVLLLVVVHLAGREP